MSRFLITVPTFSVVLVAAYILLTAFDHTAPVAPRAADPSSGRLVRPPGTAAAQAAVLPPGRYLKPVTIGLWKAGVAMNAGTALPQSSSGGHWADSAGQAAAIAVEGNPSAQVVTARVAAQISPGQLTVAQARRDAEALRRSVAYFKAVGARVVNMDCFASDFADGKAVTQAVSARETVPPPSVLARQVRALRLSALADAVKSAPGILFVTGTGHDAAFDPARLRLPNVLTVGAAEEVGANSADIYAEEASPEEPYAADSPLARDVPDGRRRTGRGTSVSAPQATNLAAKVLAVAPALTPAQVRGLILKGAERRAKNGRTILLLDPAHTLALVRRPVGMPVEAPLMLEASPA